MQVWGILQTIALFFCTPSTDTGSKENLQEVGLILKKQALVVRNRHDLDLQNQIVIWSWSSRSHYFHDLILKIPFFGWSDLDLQDHQKVVILPISGYFYGKTKTSKANLRVNYYHIIYFLKYWRQCTLLPPTWAKSLNLCQNEKF